MTVPWLEVNGVEVANANRTLTYMRRRPQCGCVEVAVRDDWLLEESPCGYTDAYEPNYEVPCFTPWNLACFCAATSAAEYVSPADDPAPWFDPGDTDSAEFSGLLLDRLDHDAVASNAVTPASEGATVGRRAIRHRTVTVEGTLFASSDCGVAWGERWLRRVLAGTAEGCGERGMRILPCCPPDEDAPEPDSGEQPLPDPALRYFRSLGKVGVVDGPTFTPVDGFEGCGECVAERFMFQLVAGGPYLLAPPEDVLADQPLTGDSVLCGEVEALALGDEALRITFRAGQVGSSLRNVGLALYDGGCPATGSPTHELHVDYVPRGWELEIDASSREVRLHDPITGEEGNPLQNVTWEGIFPWFEVLTNETGCVCVDATAAALNPGSRVHVESIAREL